MDAFSVDLDAALDQLEAEMAGANQQPMQSMLLDSSTSRELSSDASKFPTASSSNSASAANGDCNGQAHSATSVTIVYAQQPTVTIVYSNGNLNLDGLKPCIRSLIHSTWTQHRLVSLWIQHQSVSLWTQHRSVSLWIQHQSVSLWIQHRSVSLWIQHRSVSLWIQHRSVSMWVWIQHRSVSLWIQHQSVSLWIQHQSVSLWIQHQSVSLWIQHQSSQHRSVSLWIQHRSVSMWVWIQHRSVSLWTQHQSVSLWIQYRSVSLWIQHRSVSMWVWIQHRSVSMWVWIQHQSVSLWIQHRSVSLWIQHQSVSLWIQHQSVSLWIQHQSVSMWMWIQHRSVSLWTQHQSVSMWIQHRSLSVWMWTQHRGFSTGQCSCLFSTGQCSCLFSTGQCSCLFSTGQCSCLFSTGQCSCLFSTGQCSCLFSTGQCSCLFSTGQCSCLFSTGQCSCLFSTGQCSCLFSTGQCSCLFSTGQCSCLFSTGQCSCLFSTVLLPIQHRDPVSTSVPNASAGAPAEEESALNNNLAAPANTSKAINNLANSAAVASPSTSASNSLAEASSNPTSLVSSIRFADLAKGLPELTEADLELILEQEPAQPTQQSAVLQSQWSISNYQDYAEQDEQTSSFNPMYGLVGGAGCLATEAAVSSSQIADSNPGTVVGGGGLNPMYSLQEERQQPASLGATGGGVTSPPSPPPPPQQLTDAAESDAEAELQTDLPSQNDVAEDVAESETPPQQQPLGSVKPAWIPDSEAPVCMQCEARFTVLRRRHHCRACGRVFCANCAAYTARLAFLDNDKARVCAVCYQELIRLESNPEARSVSQQPPVSVLKSTRSQVVRSRSVVFSDGIRPGGDLLEDNAGDADDFQVNDSTVGGVAAAAAVSSFPAESSSSSSSLEPSLLPADWESYPPHEPLPTDDSNSGAVALSPEAALRNGGSVTYQVTMNISAQCRLVSLPCCGHPSAWLLVTRGLDSVGQTDLLLLLSRRPPAIDGTDESILPPLHLLHLVYAVYERAYAGSLGSAPVICWLARRPAVARRP
uniref:FYVE-type domain-containing protein n=1 Tax=Macrostomum lignano TaxID=282301 RepID=A0A1I8HZS9_9PLAT